MVERVIFSMLRFRGVASRALATLRSSVLDWSARFRLRVLTTRYFFDPMVADYQPLPWIGLHEAIRGEATLARWEIIDLHLSRGVSSVKDLGCCVGYFCHMFASNRGGFAIGIDQNAEFLEVANFVRLDAGLQSREAFLNIELSPSSVEVLPRTEATFILSIWHHWVLHRGLTDATEMLASVWESTSQVLFFESGEEEVAEEFNLPFSSNAREWLFDYLSGALVGSHVELIGEFPAGNYTHYEGGSKNLRGLFKVTRQW